jgi:nucleoside phosphorylase
MRVTRQRLVNPLTTQPMIKSGHQRDELAWREETIAVEMTWAGFWKYGPSIVIKGVCDYAGSHKRKGWQRYAAAAAAACTKPFLIEWTPEQRQSGSG